MSLNFLADKIAKKDEKAFEQAYNELNKAVFSICLGFVKREAVAKELAQDTFVAVWSYAYTFKGSSFKSWVLTIAKNKSLNYLEKYKKEISVDFTNSEEYSLIENEEVDKETKITLKSAVNRLDEIDRQIVLLKSSGMKMKEIALYLNMPRGTASWRYKEALNKIKNYMEGKGL